MVSELIGEDAKSIGVKNACIKRGVMINSTSKSIEQRRKSEGDSYNEQFDASILEE